MFGRAIACAVVSAAILWSTTIRVYNLQRPVIEQRLQLAHKGKAARHDTVLELFSKAGCTGHLSEQPVKHAKTPNVICTSPGVTGSTIVVGAHYDCADEGVGAIDNWSGAALLSSLYEGLKTVVRNHTFVFVAFTDEESGLGGVQVLRQPNR